MIVEVTKEGGYVEDSVSSAGKACECKTLIFCPCYSGVNQ